MSNIIEKKHLMTLKNILIEYYYTKTEIPKHRKETILKTLNYIDEGLLK